MEKEDLFASLEGRQVHRHLAVEAAGTEKRRVERVGTVRRGDDDDALVGVEAVHLDEHRVQGLLVGVAARQRARAAALHADGVDLVDEDDAGRALLRLREHVAHARGADADEHLLEVAARDGEERDPSLAGDRAREERLARAGRPDEEDALRDAAAELLEGGRFLQESDDLLHLLLRLVDARDVRERRALLLLLAREHLGAGLAHAEGPAVAAHAAGEEPIEECERGEEEEDVHHEGREGARLVAHLDLPPGGLQRLHQVLVLAGNEVDAVDVLLAVFGGAVALQVGDAVVLVDDTVNRVGHAAGGAFAEELDHRQLAGLVRAGAHLVERQDGKPDEGDQQPGAAGILGLLFHVRHYIKNEGCFGII